MVALATPAAAQPAGETECDTDFLEIAPGISACGFSLSRTGAFSKDGDVLADPLIAAYEDDGSAQKPIAAGQAILFPPSPSGRFRIVQACDGTGANALCWSVLLLDAEEEEFRKSLAGHYGPERWQSWGPEGRFVALTNSEEGARWLYMIEAESGESHAFPPFDLQENWTIDLQSLRWIKPGSLTVKVKTCETCAVEDKMLQF
ncbi:hypothetical protein [Chelativorans sp. YIM 93263]|uniref:hypothetical protein n=1 Tax=Chelativorans sp. YIM 93263 TaxID=2906648 RepID=UPI002379560C|nr:hypothetical protein [Chelativorans sp. YIM 93263]